MFLSYDIQNKNGQWSFILIGSLKEQVHLESFPPCCFSAFDSEAPINDAI